jgi:outer membrane protein assembly factor BamB
MRRVTRRGWVLGLALAGGCRALSPGAYLEPAPPVLRAGVIELRWHRRVADYFDLDFHPQFHGGPAYDPRRDWILAGSVDNGLYALRARDGAVVWRFETLDRVDSTPTIAGDTVFFGSNDGGLYALDLDHGTLRWRVSTPAEVVQPPVVFEGGVYFVNANDTVYAVNAADGGPRWHYRRNPAGGISLSGHAGLARAGRRLYTGFSDGVVACLNLVDGSVLWEQDTSSDLENIEERNEAHEAIDVDTTPVVLGDTVYVASYAAGLYALDTLGGGRRWRLETLPHVAALGTDGRYLYAGSATSGLLKVDPYDGSIVWARDLASHAILGVVPLSNGLLAVPTGDRALWIVRAADGEPIDGIEPGRGFGALPALAGNRLFIESNAAVLYALRFAPSAGRTAR